MAYLLSVAVVDADGMIRTVHQFYGLFESAARTYKETHFAVDPSLRAAHAEGRTVESLEEIDNDELPTREDFEEDDEEDEEEEQEEREYMG